MKFLQRRCPKRRIKSNTRLNIFLGPLNTIENSNFTACSLVHVTGVYYHILIYIESLKSLSGRSIYDSDLGSSLIIL